MHEKTLVQKCYDERQFGLLSYLDIGKELFCAALLHPTGAFRIMNLLHNCNLSFFWIAGTNQSQRIAICLKYDGKLPLWREATYSLKPAESSNRLNKLQTLHSAKPSAWDCSRESMRSGKNTVCLTGSCQAPKRREFLCLDFPGKDLKDQGMSSFGAAHQVMASLHTNCKPPCQSPCIPTYYFPSAHQSHSWSEAAVSQCSSPPQALAITSDAW